MDTIEHFSDNYADSGFIRAHMPGHKGREYPHDITEITGADSLYEASGIISESERVTSEIFGSYKTVYSAGGSTLCIQTMVTMCMSVSGSKRIVAVRNCHRAFLSACILAGAEPDWIYPEYESTVISGKISPESVEKAIVSGDKPACVYVTSPDYLGKITPIDEIAGICHKHGVFLAVDNAHGAYLRFIRDEHGTPLHPLFRGADICCDSAHKTLPVLTGGAYLHINDPRLEKYEGFAKEIMSLYGSSSPSYLILRSLGMCAAYMRDGAERDFAAMKTAADRIKAELSEAWHIESGECGKLTIFAPPSGYTGTELAELLRENKIECEYADHTHLVLMLTGLYPEEIETIGNVLKVLPMRRIFIPVPELEGIEPTRKAMSIREAAFSDSECIDADNAVGRICARAVSCCPPGVAIVTGGEIFSESLIKILKNYSIFKVNVVK